MDKILDFLADNYVIFIGISAILLLALIGFIVTGRKKKKGDVQVADPMAQPTSADTPMPSAPFDASAPTTTTEPIAPATPMPSEPVSNAQVTPLQDTPVSTTNVEPQPVSMEPMESANSDEPTLVIEDKTATPSEAASLFTPPNPTQTGLSTPEQNSVPSDTVVPQETPVTPEVPVDTIAAPAAPEEAPTSSIFENQ